MIRMVQRRLIIPRGDTGSFSIPYLKHINQGDVAVFTIFDVITHTKLFQKVVAAEGDVLNIAFSHNETVNLQPGKYLWDIKIYTNPQFVDDKLVNGEEIDSYYAGFSLPECEIRETGDSLLMSDDTPQAKLAPDQIDLISAAITATQTAKEVAMNSAADAETSASAAATSAQVASDSKDAALASQTSAATSESNAAESAAAAQESATQAAQIAQQIHEEIPTKVSDLVDDSGHYTKPATGIPASDLEETYLTEHQDLSNYVQKTDYATRNSAGIVKISPTFGIDVAANILNIARPTIDMLKAGNNMYRPVVTADQHTAAFYGLAKAAGSDEKNSELPVGQYTDAAKAAIQAMLDVPSTADIPTNVSELTNDAGYLTKHQDISGKANSADLAAVATSGSYEDLSDKPTIPEVPVQDVQINGTSILENGIAMIPAASYSNGQASLGLVKAYGLGISVDSSGEIAIQKASDGQIKRGSGSWAPVVASNEHLAAFYGLAKAAGADEKNSELSVGQYTDSAKTAIQTMLDVPSNAAMTTAIGNAIGNINSFDMAVVQALPTEDIGTHTIYLVPKTGDTNDVYDEYVYINDAWEMVGNTQIDLSNYVQKTDYATANDPGVVYLAADGGLQVVVQRLAIKPATDDQIKKGTKGLSPATIAKQHQSVFYGLAKAAGDTTQSQSDNAVGTYTTEAKAAIQTMLDVPSTSDIPDVSIYATKADTVLETTLSMGRKANTDIGFHSTTIGYNNIASGNNTFATGSSTSAKGLSSATLGTGTVATGNYQLTYGRYNIEETPYANWVSETHYNIGDKIVYNNAGFICIEENSDDRFLINKWKILPSTSNSANIVGNGTVSNHSNAYALDWDGNGYYMGDVYVGANADSTGGTKVLCEADFATDLDIQNIINGGAGA